MIVEFAWPPSVLGPNDRPHWATKARAVKKYKTDCMWRCKAAGLKEIAADGAHLVVSFYPPDFRLRDRDNQQASCKNLVDAISEIIGINDNKFTFEYVFANKFPNGLVKVEIVPKVSA